MLSNGLKWNVNVDLILELATDVLLECEVNKENYTWMAIMTSDTKNEKFVATTYSK